MHTFRLILLSVLVSAGTTGGIFMWMKHSTPTISQPTSLVSSATSLETAIQGVLSGSMSSVASIGVYTDAQSYAADPTKVTPLAT